MNIFFYAAAAAPCSGGCNFKTCSRKCLSMLAGLPSLNNLRVLPPGSELNTPTSMQLRSGDILILFAESREEVDRLISFKHIFDTFRIILIVGEEELVRNRKHFCLTPRYTIVLGKEMDTLGAVIERMVAGSDRHTDFDLTQQENTYA